MTKKIISLLMLLTLVMSCFPVAQAASVPEVITHPEPQIVIEGGKCTFTAAGKGHTGITWRLRSPDGSEDFPFTDAPKHFSGLKVSGKNSNKLTLSKIPGEMDGWLVYCCYSNKAGKTNTDMVPLFVTDRSGNRINGNDAMPAATPAPAADDVKTTFTQAEGEKVLRAIGCVIHFVDKDGNIKGDSFTELNFGEAYYNPLTRKTVTDGSVDVKISAEIPKGKRVAYWVINGAKYTFNNEVKSFTLREVPYGMVIEAVLSGNTAQTLPTAEEIQQRRTGTPLLVETKSARMSHVNDKNKASGGSFTEFDFTDDFTNNATGETEQGGRVTVRVAASIPEGKLVTYWRFNGARLNFNSDVTSFVVENLAESMLYQPVFYTKTTPVPEYTINCTSCTFSGGGYSNAKSGTVPYGTKITITPIGGSYTGYWTGSYNAGNYSDGVSAKPITWTVKNNCSFYWHAEIN
ncbi:MAG: hypothetical protein IKL25_06840 [Clostridia bacterium]|nr:hypothetical protein [Clostridia bacterium]